MSTVPVFAFSVTIVDMSSCELSNDACDPGGPRLYTTIRATVKREKAKSTDRVLNIKDQIEEHEDAISELQTELDPLKDREVRWRELNNCLKGKVEVGCEPFVPISTPGIDAEVRSLIRQESVPINLIGEFKTKSKKKFVRSYVWRVYDIDTCNPALVPLINSRLDLLPDTHIFEDYFRKSEVCKEDWDGVTTVRFNGLLYFMWCPGAFESLSTGIDTTERSNAEYHVLAKFFKEMGWDDNSIAIKGADDDINEAPGRKRKREDDE